jgi:hypothetical protein
MVAEGLTREVKLITIKRLHLSVTTKEYGHWWFEIGDPRDADSESYGWWPENRLGKLDTLMGVRGILNGAEEFLNGRNFGNPPPRDPHHGRMAEETFHPRVTIGDPARMNRLPIASDNLPKTRKENGAGLWVGDRTAIHSSVRPSPIVVCKSRTTEPNEFSEDESMVTPTRNGPLGEPNIEYFGSFSGYGHELKPIMPLSFEQTRDAAAYLEVERDRYGYVAILRSIGTTRIPGQAISHPIASPRPAGTKIFFRVNRVAENDETQVGDEIEYGQTRGLREYFAGLVDETNSRVSLRQYQRDETFCERYEHDVYGRLLSASHRDFTGQKTVNFSEATTQSAHLGANL